MRRPRVRLALGTREPSQESLSDSDDGSVCSYDDDPVEASEVPENQSRTRPRWLPSPLMMRQR